MYHNDLEKVLSMRERLFLALWPNDQIQGELNQMDQLLRPHMKGRWVPSNNWHITLAFLGSIDSAMKQCVQEVATTIERHPFSFSLDLLGYWPKKQILWLGCHQSPKELGDLISDLTIRLQQNCHYQPETRPFHPHLTLMRKASPIKALPSIKPIVWSVKDFCLVHSITDSNGAHYQVIARWLFH